MKALNFSGMHFIFLLRKKITCAILSYSKRNIKFRNSISHKCHFWYTEIFIIEEWRGHWWDDFFLQRICFSLMNLDWWFVRTFRHLGRFVWCGIPAATPHVALWGQPSFPHNFKGNKSMKNTYLHHFGHFRKLSRSILVSFDKAAE